jgi:putative ABC transport system permease protein
MALLHFKRQRLQTFFIVFSLAVALACSGLLLQVYSLSQSRYKNLPADIQAILGPKSGGIEILLGALNLEEKFHGAIPENIFQTLRAGADIRFEDGSVVSSKNFTESVIPITFLGNYKIHPVIATDESFFSGTLPATNEVWVGAMVAKKNHLEIENEIQIEAKGTLSKKSVLKTLKISKILPTQENSWDSALFVNQQNTESWLLETQSNHPVWRNKTLNYVLFKMKSAGFQALQSLVNDRTVSQLIWVDQEKQKLDELTSSAKDLGVIIILVIFALAGFSIFGMMSIRAQALRVSVATLEAIGYLPSYVYSWIFYEALIVGAISSTIAVVLEFISFEFIKTSLGSTWLIPAAQSNILMWAGLIILEGLIFSLFGALISCSQMLDLKIHSELKSG